MVQTAAPFGAHHGRQHDESAPHFHLFNQHSHDHDDADHHHHHPASQVDCSEKHKHGMQLCLPLIDHDADAIYVCDTGSYAASSRSAFVIALLVIANGLTEAYFCPNELAIEMGRSYHGPPICDQCKTPLFIRLQSLRN